MESVKKFGGYFLQDHEIAFQDLEGDLKLEQSKIIFGETLKEGMRYIMVDEVLQNSNLAKAIQEMMGEKSVQLVNGYMFGKRIEMSKDKVEGINHSIVMISDQYPLQLPLVKSKVIQKRVKNEDDKPEFMSSKQLKIFFESKDFKEYCEVKYFEYIQSKKNYTFNQYVKVIKQQMLKSNQFHKNEISYKFYLVKYEDQLIKIVVPHISGSYYLSPKLMIEAISSQITKNITKDLENSFLYDSNLKLINIKNTRYDIRYLEQFKQPFKVYFLQYQNDNSYFKKKLNDYKSYDQEINSFGTNLVVLPKVDKLISELNCMINVQCCPGQCEEAFDNEYKVRQYVALICKYVVLPDKGKQMIYLQSEEPYKTYGNPKYIRKIPDFQLKYCSNRETSMIIEVKKYFESRFDPFQHLQQTYDIKNHIIQSLSQLRTFCIDHKKEQMVGVLTNGRTWIFTKYDLKEEIQNRPCFWHSSQVKIFKFGEKIEFDRKVVQQILNLLEQLNIQYID